ncbi:MAG TPA: Hpt domain-containing protein, partial [Terriglobales bacterium]|nr:Hpt domain-containing protein [Terriglobales bacterium]
MKDHHSELIEVFLQEASERLQFLREFSSILLETYPPVQDLERLYISAHTLAGTAASYAFPLFAEIAGKLAHVYQYAINATIAPDAAGPLLEFMNEAVALLETDLIMIGSNQVEAVEDINAFKQRYPFAFPAPAGIPEAEPEILVEENTEADVHAADVLPEDKPANEEIAIPEQDPLLTNDSVISLGSLPRNPELETEHVPDPNLAAAGETVIASAAIVYEREEYPLQPEPYSPPAQEVPVANKKEIGLEEEPELEPEASADVPLLPADDDVPAEILEFFVPEAEEHLQVVTHCLLALETSPGEAEVHRLLRSMHTIKGSAAQVGLHRISKVAHRAEDLITRL